MSNNLVNGALEKPLIAIDLDDVIFDCNGTLKVILVKEFSFAGTYSEFIKLNPDMVGVAFEFLYGKYHQGSLSAEGAFEALSSIAAFYKMTVITSRSEAVREQTIKWLESNFPGLFKEVYFTNSFLAAESMVRIEKHEICSNLGIRTIIEDSHEVAVNAASNNMNVLLIDRPWNQEVPQHPNIYRAKNWKDVYELLLKSHRNRSIE
jgi:uncharacterized HAD superfamily protein